MDLVACLEGERSISTHIVIVTPPIEPYSLICAISINSLQCDDICPTSYHNCFRARRNESQHEAVSIPCIY
jgi:hypothetical protein